MASTDLTRTPSSSTNRRTWTWSAWVKRGSLSDANQVLFQALDGSFPEKLQFTASDILEYDHDISGTDYTVFVTDRKFRDTNAWYHIVFAKDTTQSTEANRIKIYVNGEQQSLSEYQLGYPGQDYEGAINKNVAHYIGGNNGSEYFNGSMSHIHFCDGLQLAPTVFGETDSTTGEWKIKTDPSFTLGTNGFSILKDGNTITDQSTNSNNFSVNNGTLTKTEDNPSNIFATLNPLKTLGTTNRIISNGNTKFYTGTTHWGTMLSTLAFSSGKFYCEVKLDTLQASQGYGALGITDATENYQSNDNIQNQTSFSAGCVTDHRSGQSACKSGGSTVSSGIGDFSNGDIVGIAADMDNKALYLHKNGTYIAVGGVTGVPTSGSSKTGAITIPATCVDCMFSISSYTSDATSSVNFGNGYFGTTAVSSAGSNASGLGIFEHDVPTGYTALCTKGLNE